MNRYTMRMLLRSIRGSLGRYLAILAIVALGVGFFAGLKSSYPAMRGTAERYLDEQGQSVRRPEGYAQRWIAYDDLGREIGEGYQDAAERRKEASVQVQKTLQVS